MFMPVNNKGGKNPNYPSPAAAQSLTELAEAGLAVANAIAPVNAVPYVGPDGGHIGSLTEAAIGMVKAIGRVADGLESIASELCKNPDEQPNTPPATPPATKSNATGTPLRTCTFVEASAVFAGCTLAWQAFAAAEPDYSWGNNVRSLVSPDGLSASLEEVDASLLQVRTEVATVIARLKVMDPSLLIDLEN
jgi:hypothetical protein